MDFGVLMYWRCIRTSNIFSGEKIADFLAAYLFFFLFEMFLKTREAFEVKIKPVYESCVDAGINDPEHICSIATAEDFKKLGQLHVIIFILDVLICNKVNPKILVSCAYIHYCDNA